MGSGGFTNSGKDLSPEQIKAHGDIKTRVAIIWFVGSISALLAVGGFVCHVNDPSSAKDIWIIIGPIISGAVTGTVAFFAGQKKGE